LGSFIGFKFGGVGGWGGGDGCGGCAGGGAGAAVAAGTVAAAAAGTAAGAVAAAAVCIADAVAVTVVVTVGVVVVAGRWLWILFICGCERVHFLEVLGCERVVHAFEDGRLNKRIQPARLSVAVEGHGEDFQGFLRKICWCMYVCVCVVCLCGMCVCMCIVECVCVSGSGWFVGVIVWTIIFVLCCGFFRFRITFSLGNVAVFLEKSGCVDLEAYGLRSLCFVCVYVCM
jgi:hypothetical protein